jgi:hypothetical protein
LYDDALIELELRDTFDLFKSEVQIGEVRRLPNELASQMIERIVYPTHKLECNDEERQQLVNRILVSNKRLDSAVPIYVLSKRAVLILFCRKLCWIA